MSSEATSGLLSSSYWHLTVRLLAIFTLAWLAIATFAWFYLHDAAHSRARVDLELTVSRLVDRSGGQDAVLRDLVDQQARTEPSDDAFLVLVDDFGKPTAGKPAISDDEFVTLSREVGANTLVAGYARDEVDEPVIEAMLVFVLCGFAVGVVGLLAGLAFAKAAQRRFLLLEDTLYKASSGDLSSRAHADGRSDDVARLAGALNASLARLEKAQKALRQAGSDIAHEMRTPLNRVQLRLEKAVRGQPIERATIEDACEDLIRLATIIDETLAIAELENRGLASDQLDDIDLGDFFEGIVSAYRAVVEDADGTLDVDIPEASVAIRGDRRLLGRAFANLIENAIAYAGPRPHIILFALEDGQAVTAGVSDRGEGIPEADMPLLTQRFTRLDRSRGSKGTGLGLALVQAIAHAHGAVLELSSNHPGLRAAIRWGKDKNALA